MKVFMGILAVITFLCVIPACMIGEAVLAIMCAVCSVLLLVSSVRK